MNYLPAPKLSPNPPYRANGFCFELVYHSPQKQNPSNTLRQLSVQLSPLATAKFYNTPTEKQTKLALSIAKLTKPSSAVVSDSPLLCSSPEHYPNSRRYWTPNWYE